MARELEAGDPCPLKGLRALDIDVVRLANSKIESLVKKGKSSVRGSGQQQSEQGERRAAVPSKAKGFGKTNNKSNLPAGKGSSLPYRGPRGDRSYRAQGRSRSRSPH